MKVLKAGRESAEQDYKYLVQDFQPFPRDGTVSKVSFDKTMELRAKEGIYHGKKIPPASDYVDSSMNDEALKLAGFDGILGFLQFFEQAVHRRLRLGRRGQQQREKRQDCQEPHG